MKNLFEEDDNGQSGSADFGKMFESSLKGVGAVLKAGDKIKGEILSIGKEEAFVSTGTVNDGVMARADLPKDDNGHLTVKVGDTLDLFVVQVKGSEVRVSTKPTAKNLADDLEDAFDMMLPVEGKVSEVINGGYRVVLMGKTAFCPFSQIDLRKTDSPEAHLNKKYSFLITKFEGGGRNITVSRRKLLEEEQGASAAAFKEDVKVGDIVKGTVTRLEAFGAFVELSPGLDGLVHVSEIAWSRVSNPADALKPGQSVQAKVLRIEENDGRMRISLSIKQAGEQPWDSINTLRVGEVVSGRVTRCMKFGCFVEVKPGIEGLVPLGEMSYTKRVTKSDELMKEGETVTVMIKEINEEDQKILLSLKDAGGDPWSLVPMKMPVGAILNGKVTRREPYGIFVEVAPGVVGLMPRARASDVPDYPFEKLKIGDATTVQVAELNIEDRKMSLAPPADPDAEAWKDVVMPTSKASMGTLADQFKLALEKGASKKK
ncbi:MAG: S1 RNA-binding domain-containing protein [Bdellovibrionaceae bacterium]|nr:S1 RNA-binding domain-containing protein [Pseudobdellovibrionaceae bacterium]